MGRGVARGSRPVPPGRGGIRDEGEECLDEGGQRVGRASPRTARMVASRGVADVATCRRRRSVGGPAAPGDPRANRSAADPSHPAPRRSQAFGRPSSSQSGSASGGSLPSPSGARHGVRISAAVAARGPASGRSARRRGRGRSVRRAGAQVEPRPGGGRRGCAVPCAGELAEGGAAHGLPPPGRARKRRPPAWAPGNGTTMSERSNAGTGTVGGKQPVSIRAGAAPSASAASTARAHPSKEAHGSNVCRSVSMPVPRLRVCRRGRGAGGSSSATRLPMAAAWTDGTPRPEGEERGGGRLRGDDPTAGPHGTETDDGVHVQPAPSGRVSSEEAVPERGGSDAATTRTGRAWSCRHDGLRTEEEGNGSTEGVAAGAGAI